MANMESYKALLKVERWRDVQAIEAVALSKLSADMEVVRQAILSQSETIRRLKISKKVREYSSVNRGCMVTGTPEEQAQAICSADGEVDVYRYPSGAITWRTKGKKAPIHAEFVGSYDDGADWRRVAEDLQL